MNDPEKRQYGDNLDMLVADKEHERLVMATLGDGAQAVDSDATLGLTLIRLTNATKVRDTLVDQLPEKWPPDAPRPSTTWSDLDKVVAYLRVIFEHDYDGWTPKIGKNRFMTGIQFVTYPNAEVPGFTSIATPTDASANKLTERIAKAPPDQRKKGEGIRVGLLDTHLYQHHLLAGRYITPPDSLLLPSPTKPLSYVEGHAMFLGSLVLAEAPSAQLDVRAVARSRNGNRSDRDTTIWAVARQMVQYRSSGVRILNCSWACYTRDGKPPLVLERAVDLLAPEVLVVAAAGNHGKYMAGKDSTDPRAEDKAYRKANQLPPRNAPAYPAALPDVVAVGARDPADFNPKGRELDVNPNDTEPDVNPKDVEEGTLAPWIGVLAPGVDVLGAYFGDRDAAQKVKIPKLPSSGDDWTTYSAAEPEYEDTPFRGAARWSGTSFAAATVSGAIAARLQSCGSPREALEQVLKEDGRITQT